MSRPARWVTVSPIFEGRQVAVSLEESRNAADRWKVCLLRGQGNVHLTTNEVYELADALDRALDWYEQDEDRRAAVASLEGGA
jgi:hypothetical protein